MQTGPVYVMTCDQRSSRRSPDAVPAAQEALVRLGDGGCVPLLAAERTAGDEFQTVFDDAACVVAAVEALIRLGHWRIGVGVGDIDHPIPESTRAARGSAFLAAREAVDDARRHAGHLAVRSAVRASPDPSGGDASRVVGGDPYRVHGPADAAEHALVLLVATLARRTDAGWEIVDLIDQGLNGRQAADRLGISESAVSQRLTRAAHEEACRARALATDLLRRAGERR